MGFPCCRVCGMAGPWAAAAAVGQRHPGSGSMVSWRPAEAGGVVGAVTRQGRAAAWQDKLQERVASLVTV
jgi:hypothetical protein